VAIKNKSQLKEFGSVLRGVTFDPEKDFRPFGSEHSIELLRSNNIQENVLVLDNTYNLSLERVKNDQILNYGDILICMANGSKDLVGKTAFVSEKVSRRYTFGSFMGAFRPHKQEQGAFLQYLFQTAAFRDHVNLVLAGSSINNLTPALIEEFVFEAPEIDEQKAIAEALSDIDELIARLKQEISKRKNIFQAALATLLSNSDLPEDIQQGWEKYTLKELGNFYKGKGITKSEVRESGLACIRYGEIYTKFSAVIHKFYSYIDAETAKASVRIKMGDILLAGSGETKEEIGKATAFLFEDEAYAGGDIVIFRPHNVDSRFFGYLLNSPMVTSQKARAGKGDAVVHISASDLENITVVIPQKDEQVAISQILFDIEKSISTCEEQLLKMEMLKQGMMHDLLTGRVRLV